MSTPAQVIEQSMLGGYQQGVARKQQLQDEERQNKAIPLIETSKAIIAKLPNLTGADLDAAKQQLSDTQSAFNELYHPIKYPGAMQRDWHYLVGKVKGIGAPKDKTPSSTTSQTPEITLNTPAAPLVTPEMPAYQQTTLGTPAPGRKLGSPVTTNVPGVPAETLPPMPNYPKGATPTMAVANPKGLVEAGNIPIWNRPSVLNDDGTHSSELSISMQDDKGNEVLIPLIVDGKFLTPNGKMPPGSIPQNAQEWDKASPEWKALRMRAWQHYQQTGQHLGKFDNADDTDAYAQVLHNRGSVGGVTIPAGPPVTVTKGKPVPWGQAQVLKQQVAARQKAQQEAGLLAAGAPLSPEQQAMSDFRSQEAVADARIASTLKRARDLGLSEEQISELKQQLLGMKNITFKPLTGVAGVPQKGPDGSYYQAGSDANGNVVTRPMPPGWKPQTKAVRGTLVNSKEHGFIQTWVDPFNPSKVVGWQKVTPSRYYQGTTSTSSTTDPFGLKTTSSRSTMPANTTPIDIDLSGTEELPDDFNGDESSSSSAATGQTPSSASTPSGSPNKSPAPTAVPPTSVTKPTTGGVTPKKAATPAQLKSQVPAAPAQAQPSQKPSTLALDSTGHIPANAPYNANLIGAANSLIDGMDITKLPIPQKAREAASNLARAYGWGGQGMFTPREALQLKEGATFLNLMANSPSLKVLDNGFFSNIPMTGASPDPIKEGFFGRLASNFSSREQTPEQQKFMDLYRQLDAMAIGLRALVQTGRGTQKQTDLLISELPNPYNTPSSEDAKRRLGLVQKELEIAAKTGKLPEFEDMQKDFNSQGSLSLDDFKKKHSLQ